MIFIKSGRLLVAVALAATFFLALPAEAADGRGSSPGILEQLITWMTGGWDGWMQTTQADERPHPNNNEGAYIDPNGGGGRTGSCSGECGGGPGPNQAIRQGNS
jgi:hypothetical protein